MKKKKILEYDNKYIWHPFTQSETSEKPLVINSASEDKLIDIDGNEYIDLISSWWVNVHGHGNKKIIDSITTQAKELDQVVFADLTHKPAVELAKNLNDILPGELTRVFYSDNGSTSVEIALKVAYQYWKNKKKIKKKFVAFEGGYHGDTLGAMSLGFSSGFYEPFKDLVFKSLFIPFPEDWKGNNAIDEDEERSFKAIDNIININGNEIAAVIIEPLVQGASGMKICRPDFLNKVVKKFQSNDILVIFDEVMTGFGRTGKMFASDFLEVCPDIICLAKSITSGYLPIAATVFKEKIHQEFVDLKLNKAFLHGHSFTANPIACSAAIQSMKIFKNENTLELVKNIEKVHKDGLQLLSKNPQVNKTRFLGGIAAFNILGFDKGYGARIGEKIKRNFLKKGYLIRPLGETIYLMPPFCIKEKILEKVYQDLDEEINKIKI